MVTCCNLNAQQPYNYTINDENGLPSNEVYQILQDPFGYLWIGCDAGLYRYDGFEFTKFSSPSSSGRSISGLALDSKGRVWCRNFNGQVFRTNGDSLLLIVDRSRIQGDNSMYALDDQNCLWMIQGTRLIKRSDSGDSLYSIALPSKEVSRYAGILFADNHVVVTDNANTIYSFSILDQKFKLLQSASDNPTVYKTSAFVVDRRLYVLRELMNGDRFSLMFEENGQLVHAGINLQYAQQDRIYNLCSAGKDKLAVCGSNGLRIYDLHSKQWSHQFAGRNISSLYVDRENLTWISTLQEGLFVVPTPTLIRVNASNPEITDQNFTDVAVSKSSIIVGSHKGRITELDLNGGVVRTLAINAPTVSTKQVKVHGDSVWIAHGPLSVFSNGKLVKRIPIYNARDFCIVGDSLYYVCSEISGVTSVNASKTSAEIYGARDFGGGRSVCYSPAENATYYALNRGLFYYRHGVLKEIQHKGQPVFVNSLAVSRDLIYAATVSMGLLIIKDGVVENSIDAANSVITNELKVVHVDQNFIWTASNTALYRIDKDLKSTAQFSHSHGINAKDINTIDSNDSLVFLATNKGLLIFPRRLEWLNAVAPGVYLSRVAVDNVSVPFSSTVVLPHRNQLFTIEFSSVALRSRGKYKVLYRMIGLDTSWHELQASARVITYQSIPPGEYRFEIRAVNESGISGKSVVLAIQTEYPIWQRWWFYIIATIAVLMTIALVAYARIKYIQRKAETEKRMITSQLTALKAQMNPHFMYNALNSIQALILQHDTENSNLYLGKFSSLMRNVLDSSGKEFITLQEELDILELYLSLEKLRFGDDFVYLLHVEENIDRHALCIPPILLQPFVENAIKHGLLHKRGMKRLKISFYIDSDLVCEIEDNGVGRKRAHEIKERSSIRHRSFSTEATSERIQLLNHMGEAKFSVTTIDLEVDGAPTGTLVRLTIPCTYGSEN